MVAVIVVMYEHVLHLHLIARYISCQTHYDEIWFNISQDLMGLQLMISTETNIIHDSLPLVIMANFGSISSRTLSNIIIMYTLLTSLNNFPSRFDAETSRKINALKTWH